MIPSKIELFVKPVDLRKGQLGLLSILEGELNKESREDVLYIFINGSRSLMKALYWDRTGYCILSKKLLKGRFCLPLGDRSVEIDKKDLVLFMDGLNLF